MDLKIHSLETETHDCIAVPDTDTNPVKWIK
jgi:hypothetical protein